jgi:hypothetical protein
MAEQIFWWICMGSVIVGAGFILHMFIKEKKK